MRKRWKGPTTGVTVVALLTLLLAGCAATSRDTASYATHRPPHARHDAHHHVGSRGGRQAPKVRHQGRHAGRYGGRHRGPVPPPGVPANAEPAAVVRHVDGDTVHLVGLAGSHWLRPGQDTSVRLLEINTPESVDPQAPVQCYAEKASHALARLLPEGAHAWVVADRELNDRYGRTLLYVWTARGRFVNLTMVSRGYAEAMLYEPNDRYIGRMRAAQTRARGAGRGLWSSCAYFGQPITAAGLSAHSPRHGRHTDPRFSTCAEAVDAGYGNYVRGRDPEYSWYDDADGDGVVCEH